MNKIKEVIRTKIKFKPAVFVAPQQEGIELRPIRRRNMKKEGWSEGLSKRREEESKGRTGYISYPLYSFSITSLYLLYISYLLTFRVGVSSPVSAVHSSGTISNL